MPYKCPNCGKETLCEDKVYDWLLRCKNCRAEYLVPQDNTRILSQDARKYRKE